MTCPYCGESPQYLKTSTSVYGRDYGPVYYCHPCQAWVGCHKGTTRPLGRLANAELRRWKVAAHQAFDPLWQRKMTRDGVSKQVARALGYKWLASKLELSPKECHIGMFDVETCRRVVDLVGGTK